VLKLQQKDDVSPVCPHCKIELAEVWYRELKGGIGKRLIYFCPKCKACLGVSHRKGFFMGL
jgi:uncharacterized protein with PIN domain